MATFSPKRIDLQNINNGTRYEAYDGISSEAVNAPIEASAYAQDLSERAIVKSDNALEKVNDSNAGIVTLGAYPIGSIYVSVNSVSPAELFGGTWEQISVYKTFSVSRSIIMTIQSTEWAMPLVTVSELNTMFYNTHGFYLTDNDLALLAVYAYNGDQTANAGSVIGIERNPTGFQFCTDLTVGIPARINFSAYLNRLDTRYHWRRLG